MTWVEALGVFAAVFALDFAWSAYTLATVQQRANRAALYAAAIIALSGASIIGYTSNHWLLIPAALGAYAGTYAAIVWERIKHAKR